MLLRIYLTLVISCFLCVHTFGQIQTMAAPGDGGGGTAPATPPNPTASTNYCGPKTLYRTGTVPSGEVWYWQTVSNGTSIDYSASTYTAPTTGTYYIRAYKPSNNLWSSGSGYISVTVNPNPSAPSIPTFTDYCYEGYLTRGTPPTGVTWYWQGTNSSGTSTSNSETTYTVNSSGTYYIRAQKSDGCWSSTSTGLTVSLTTPPNTPPNPLSSGNSCGDVTLSWNGAPPTKDDRWYWQTSSSGTSQGNASSSWVVSTSGTYYLRAFSLLTGCWSQFSGQVTVTVNPIPPVPSTPSQSGTCGPVTLTRGTPPSGITWYWQTDPNGAGTLFSDVTYTANSSGTYYLRARDNNSGCWSSSSSSVTVTVNPYPDVPSNPIIQESCGTGVLARGTPPSGITWYWQGIDSNGTSTLNANTTYTTGSSGTYYLRARNNTTGCWSTSSSSIALTIYALPDTPAGPTLQSNCGTAVLAQGTPPSGITWYWQGTNSSGTSTFDSNTTYSAATSGTYYLRARNNSTGCWSSSSSSLAVTVNPAVGNPGVTNGSREEPGIVNLSSTIGTNGNDNRWYTASSGGSPFGTGTAHTPNLSATTTFYVSSFQTTTGCESSRVPVTAYIYPKPAINSTADAFVMGSTITLSTANTYDSYSWKKDGVSFASSPTAVVSESGTYTVVVTKSTMTGSGTSEPKVLSEALNGQSMTYVVSNQVLQEGVTTVSQVGLLSAGDRHRSVTYIGGMGNALQTILSQESPLKKDMVMPVAYDAHGRQLEQYLPYISSSNDSKYRPLALVNTGYANSEQYLFYQQGGMKIQTDTKPFSKTEVEPSPLQHPLSFTGAGDAWHTGNKKVTSAYLLGRLSENIRLWKVVSGFPVSSSAYPDYELHVSVLTDENGNKTKTYVDKLGRTILKTVEASATEWLSTAFIYDDFGRLAFTITPEGVKTGNFSPDQTFLDKWAFQYRYDVLGRLVEYKAPAGGWMYTVYDELNRPVLTQNADQRIREEWSFVKYDIYGRAVLTGYKVISGTAGTRANVQASVDAQTYNFELGESSAIGYTLNRTFPTATATDLLSVSYYDSYDFLSYAGWDAEVHNFAFVPELGHAAHFSLVTGLPTGSKVRLIADNPTAQWLNAVQYYDNKYRPIQLLAENHTGGLDRATNKYAWSGRLEENKAIHNGPETVTVLRRLSYDHANRLTAVYQTINALPEQLIAKYEYNELGQLVDKKLHNKGGNDFLQSVDYRYNIRGWVRSINNSQLAINTDNDEAGDFFGMEMLYNTAETGLNDQIGDHAYYNGNIAAVKWKGSGTGTGVEGERSYKFVYDKAGRLKNSTSQARSATGWNVDAGAFNENMTYDHNGNIGTLTRKGIDLAGTIATVDNLTYTYDANKLTKVTDTGIALGFNDQANNTTEYAYDSNGSLTKDDNKGISNIAYNMLNKPKEITFTNGRILKYTYSAAGTKLKMEEFMNMTAVKTTDYVGGFVYEDGALSFFGSAEGRVKVKKEDRIAWEFTSDTEGWEAVYQVTNFVWNSSGSAEGTITGSDPHIASPAINVPIDKNTIVKIRMKVNSATYGAQLFFTTTANSSFNEPMSKKFTLVAQNDVFHEYTVDMSSNSAWNGTLTKLRIDPVHDGGGNSFAIDYVKVIKSIPEYQYAISDHQGNTRVVFSSVTPAPEDPLASFEGDSKDDVDQYRNIDPNFVVTFLGANHTPSGGKVVKMNQTYKVGPSKSLKVFPGDKVDMEVWEYHEGSAGFGTSSTANSVLINLVSAAFGGVSGGGGESGAIYNGVDEAITIFGTGGNQGTSRPAAYLNFILFDKDYNVLDAGWQLAPDVTFTQQKLSFPTKEIDQEGYLFVYLSYDNDSDNWVYFDDFKVTHSKTNVIQYNEYYPFGLQTANSWTREGASNNFLYNGGSELNANSGWYETFFRGYDAALGRFLQVDPLAHMSGGHSPYNYAFNNPVLFNDPMGDYPREIQIEMERRAREGSGNAFISGINTYSGYHGPGSGDYWIDGSQYSDWSPNGGSQMYRQGLRYGLTDFGGRLYAIGPNGERLEATANNKGELEIPVTITRWREYDGIGNLKSYSYEFKTVTLAQAATMGLLNAQHNDPLKKHMDQARTLDKWVEAYQGSSYFEIITEAGWKDGQPLGPKIRYVINPNDGNVMDMRHVTVVGYGYGDPFGDIIEHLQYLRESTRPSAYDPQDYYSNHIGDSFANYTVFTPSQWTRDSWATAFQDFLNR